MDDRFTSLFEDEEPAPATARASDPDLARLVAMTVPPADNSDSATPFAGGPSVDLIAAAIGADEDKMSRMRMLYASGDTDRALALGAEIACEENVCEEVACEDILETYELDTGWAA